MKPNSFQKKTAGPTDAPEAKHPFKRFQPSSMLDFVPPADANKTPVPAVDVLASQKADLQTLDSNLSPNK